MQNHLQLTLTILVSVYPRYISKFNSFTTSNPDTDEDSNILTAGVVVTYLQKYKMHNESYVSHI